MRDDSPSLQFAALTLSLLVAHCRPQSATAAHEAFPATRRAGTASWPLGGVVEHASVDVTYARIAASAGDLGHGATVEYWLTLDGGGHTYRTLLDRWTTVDLPGCNDPTCAELEPLVEAKFDLRVAPDEHALAVSSDGGTRFHYVALDTGDAPLYCAHRQFVLSAGSPETWNRIATTHALVAEILASGTGPGENALHRGHGFEREYVGAMRYACRHTDDPELQAGILRAFLEHEEWQGDPHGEDYLASLACMRAIARSSVPPRLRFIAMLASPDRASRAARFLADTPEPDAQEALAQVIAPMLDTASSGSEDRAGREDLAAQLTWTLERVTTLRRDASPLVTEALVHAATSLDVPASRATAVYAVHGLASLAAHEAGTALRRASAHPCMDPVTEWPAQFTEWPASDAAANAHSVACWAQAALAARTRTFGEDRLRVVR